MCVGMKVWELDDDLMCGMCAYAHHLDEERPEESIPPDSPLPTLSFLHVLFIVGYRSFVDNQLWTWWTPYTSMDPAGAAATCSLNMAYIESVLAA